MGASMSLCLLLILLRANDTAHSTLRYRCDFCVGAVELMQPSALQQTLVNRQFSTQLMNHQFTENAIMARVLRHPLKHDCLHVIILQWKRALWEL